MMPRDDVFFMRAALRLAEKGRGWTSPNPLVGCVIVRNDRIIGRGFHERFGAAHAEINALRDAERRRHDVRGATMFVTLEPCVHIGKTPPCVDAMIRSGIRRVVIAVYDANPHVRERGARRLRRSGIRVRVGVLRDVARVQNKIFFYWMAHHMPYVIVKVAVSADNKITRVIGQRTQISSKKSQRFVHTLRHTVDAIVVGANTIRIDNPLLTTRFFKNPKNALPIIFDPTFSISRAARLFQHHHPLIITTTSAPSRSDPCLAGRQVKRSEVAAIRTYRLRNGSFPLRRILRDLAKENISSVLVEGGQYTLARFFESNVVNEWIIMRSNKTFGSGVDFIEHVDHFSKKFRLRQKIRSGTDTIEYYIPRKT